MIEEVHPRPRGSPLWLPGSRLWVDQGWRQCTLGSFPMSMASLVAMGFRVTERQQLPWGAESAPRPCTRHRCWHSRVPRQDHRAALPPQPSLPPLLCRSAAGAVRAAHDLIIILPWSQRKHAYLMSVGLKDDPLVFSVTDSINLVYLNNLLVSAHAEHAHA